MSKFAVLGTEGAQVFSGGWNLPATGFTEPLAILVLPPEAPSGGDVAIKSDMA